MDELERHVTTLQAADHRESWLADLMPAVRRHFNIWHTILQLVTDKVSPGFVPWDIVATAYLTDPHLFQEWAEVNFFPDPEHASVPPQVGEWKKVLAEEELIPGSGSGSGSGSIIVVSGLDGDQFAKLLPSRLAAPRRSAAFGGKAPRPMVYLSEALLVAWTLALAAASLAVVDADAEGRAALAVS
eukprot:CAMPEP_0195019716 /NCGR_PEP_ID=MMETSP0326_2-20130528/33453_1 /TAXON_ID=2866 ORGANISM="Crypthecodinium cohnii, Strain Seligo" /NCGR_SAMPLE_ID=MMETSP0326_2 /ASSEMBLY_ACC=CAM_ASM_000348 /LENGTH=185 /DNA_ID=CAMNT_0040037917 /DNA_START=5 /DNA_END=559 /DNA_ORIENTATION=+